MRREHDRLVGNLQTAASPEEVSESTQSTEPEAMDPGVGRILRWEHCLNARDLGGYPTQDGRMTRWGAVVRSDDPGRLSEAGLRCVLDHGIRTVVDLRRPEEVAESPNPLRSYHHCLQYVNISLADPAQDRTFERVVDSYLAHLDDSQGRFAQVLNVIARAPEGGVLIHCVAGKDRTGLISALLLRLAGVAQEVVADDYALSAEQLRAFDEEWLANGPGTRAEREKRFARFSPTREVMLEVLDHLDRRYGGVEAYASAAGITDADIAGLQQRMRETG